MLAFLTIRFAVPFLFGDGKVIGNWWQVALFVPIMLFFGGFEEIGWRGYLQDELESRFGSIVATLINCGIWAVWHLPLCLIKGTYQYSESYLWFIVSLTASAFALAAIHKVGGSVLPCILFHAVGNAIVSYGISGNEGTGMIVSSAVQIICAIGVFVFCDRTKKKVNK
ncbi:MAG: CPBP family intramembrane metalloprotease [Lachnospiraceae bacterium]|nr:CPBP family intramembrane metalloprotease [Lachnospiraceae bacterium]